LRWASGEIAAEGHPLPGATRVVKRPPGLEQRTGHVLTLTGDEWPFEDDTLHIAPPQPRLVKVAVLAGEGDAGSVGIALVLPESRAGADLESSRPRLSCWKAII